MTSARTPHDGGGWSSRLLLWRRFSSAWRPGLLASAVLVGAAAGLIVGRWTAPQPEPAAAQMIEQRLVPLVIDADGIWTAAADERTSVAEALVALRREGDPTLIRAGYDDWLAAYDSVLLRLAGVDLPAAARPVQRQFISAVTLSRDAVEVLGEAAELDDELGRHRLAIEVGRLRQRSEQLTQSARASVSDLEGQRADVAPPSPLPAFRERAR